MLKIIEKLHIHSAKKVQDARKGLLCHFHITLTTEDVVFIV